MTKKQSKDARIESLLSAAVEEFLEKGYSGASMEAIAKRAGVSKGGLYHHFSNKEVLLMEANSKLSAPVMEMALRAGSNPVVLDGLKQYIRDYISYWTSRRKELSFFFLSMSKAIESSVLMEYYKEYIIQSTGFFVEMFERAAASGEINISDPEAYGITLMGALDGVLSYVIINPQEDVELLCQRLEKVWIGGNA
ncbi:MAG: hypothetical protein K0R50_1295 [Eubacterium sp.]|jgi:AcrR family transcriptional regulator|nr:hypothetical protein [Eubacterium sp.]